MTAIRAVLSVLAALFGGGLLVLMFTAVRTAQRFRAWASWKRVPAVVTSVDWEARPEEQGVVLVVFEAEGRMSTALDIGSELHREEERAGLLERFAVGTKHEALVEPSGAAPLLVSGLIQKPVVPLIIGGIFFVLSAVMSGLAWYLGTPDNVLSRLLN